MTSDKSGEGCRGNRDRSRRGGRGSRGGHGGRGLRSQGLGHGGGGGSGDGDGGDGGGGDGGGGGIVAEHSWRPDCRRGGTGLRRFAGGLTPAQWVEAEEDDDDGHEVQPVYERQVHSAAANHIISSLAVAARHLNSNTGCSLLPDAASVLQTLVEGRAWDSLGNFYDNSLDSIIQRCVRSEELGACSTFIDAINKIHFRTKVERYVVLLIYW